MMATQNSYQVIWHMDDINVHCIGGNSYVRATSPAKAKEIVGQKLREEFPHLQSLALGSVRKRTPASDDLYIN